MAEFVVGLRGGIGTGKSTVSDLFAEKGIVIADADVSARTVVEPGKPAYLAIVEHFGKDILLPDQTLNRAGLRERVFSNPDERRFLESQTQRPIIEDLYQQIMAACSDYVILVLSTGLGKTPMMQKLLVVDAPLETQIERVMSRDNNSREQVEAIISTQPDRDLRIRDADQVIVNDGEVSRLALEVERLHQLYSTLSRQSEKDHG
jgi:dephospho-CoA kinase